ncbi:MAG: hypothetical protein R2828_30040 [Saprospiraceae bacterium]
MKTKTIINLLTLTTLTLLLTTTSCTKDPIPKPKQQPNLDLRTNTTDKNTIHTTIFQAQLINDQLQTANRLQPAFETGPDYPTIDLNDQDQLIIVDNQNTRHIITDSQEYRFPSDHRTFRIGNRIRTFLSMMNVHLPAGILQAVTDPNTGHFYFTPPDAQTLRILMAYKHGDGGRLGMATTVENELHSIIISKENNGPSTDSNTLSILKLPRKKDGGLINPNQEQQRSPIIDRQDDGRSTAPADNRIGIIQKRDTGRYMLFENVPANTTTLAEIPFDLSFDAKRPQLQLFSLLPIRPNWLNLFTDSCYPNTTVSGIEDTDTYQLEANRYILEVDVEPSYWHCLLNQPSFQLAFMIN